MFTDYFNSKKRVPSVLPKYALSSQQAYDGTKRVKETLEHLSFEHVMSHINTAKDMGLTSTWFDITGDEAIDNNTLLKLQQLGYYIEKKPKLYLITWDGTNSGIIKDSTTDSSEDSDDSSSSSTTSDTDNTSDSTDNNS